MPFLCLPLVSFNETNGNNFLGEMKMRLSFQINDDEFRQDIRKLSLPIMIGGILGFFTDAVTWYEAAIILVFGLVIYCSSMVYRRTEDNQ